MSEIGKAFCGESAQHTFNPILKNKYIPIEKSGYISHMQVHALFFTVYCNLFKFRKFNLQLLIYKCRKYVSYLPPC